MRHQRIAVAGTPDQYPFYGVDLSNHVDYMGAGGPHGEFSSFNACEPYRRTLARGRYRYVVAFPAVLASGIPWVRIVSCNPLELKDPALPPTFSGLPSADRSGWDHFRR